jgi:hypothetical protein
MYKSKKGARLLYLICNVSLSVEKITSYEDAAVKITTLQLEAADSQPKSRINVLPLPLKNHPHQQTLGLGNF